MSDERTLCLGIDLSDILTQISCYDMEEGEPVAVAYKYAGKDVYEIPSVLAYDVKYKIWYFGTEAEEKRKNAGFVAIRNIFELCMNETEIKIEDFVFSTDELLRIFLIRLLNIIKGRYPLERIKKLGLTSSMMDEKFKHKIKNAFIAAGLDEDRFFFIEHSKSYMYYALSQKSELWVNNVGLFEFYRDEQNYLRLKFVQLKIDRSQSPFIIGIDERDLTENMDLRSYDRISDFEKINNFTNMANAIFYKNVITTVYIIGSRYAEGWLDRSLRKLCVGRRIFKGENLYTRGACYASKILDEGGSKTFVLMDGSGINSNIYLRIFSGGETKLYRVVRAGNRWEDVDESVDIIPDDEDEISIVVENVITRQKKLHMLSVSSVDGRPNRLTRFTFRIRFAGAGECIITLKDNGFGEFYKSTNRIWERTLKL
ncbi:MAG: hypothetical protein K6F77_06960 [Lachnospiraceae bacterium]|nr:hypothetical protein [Lachnospiraceae bacterium]